MKITIPTTSFYPHQCSSGISNAVYFLSMVLSKKYNIQPTIVMPRYNGMKKSEAFEDFSIERFDMVKVMDFTFSRTAVGVIKRQNPDIIHSFHYGYFPATAGYMAAKSTNVPHFFTTAYHPSASWKKRLLWLYTVTQGAKIIKNSRKIFPFNKNEKNALEKHSSGRFEVIPCPLDDSVFFPKRKAQGKLTIGYAGTMLPWKGPQIAMDICKQIEKERNDVEFIFIGQGPMVPSLRRRGGRRFKFYSDVSTEKMAQLYNSIDVMITPTKYESFGYVLAEAAMCGTPAVTTRVGAVPETVGSGGILVDYGDWAKMKDEVSRLLDDQRLRKKLSKAAIKQSSNYKKEKVVKKIYKSYRQV